MNKKCIGLAIILLGIQNITAQSNTAVTSGSIGKCRVWDFPYTLYNNVNATQYINNGVTVTVDQNRNIGAIVPGGGVMDITSGSITLDANGGEYACRWEIPGGGSYTLVNNNGVSPGGQDGQGIHLGAIFGSAISANYYWIRGGGWSASTYGGLHSGSVNLKTNTQFGYTSIFYENTTGSCGIGTGVPYTPPTWQSSIGPIYLNTGQTLSYGASTGYTAYAPSCYPGMNFTRGTATILMDN